MVGELHAPPAHRSQRARRPAAGAGAVDGDLLLVPDGLDAVGNTRAVEGPLDVVGAEVAGGNSDRHFD